MAVAVLLLGVAAAHADDEPSPASAVPAGVVAAEAVPADAAVPDDATLERRGATIGEVRVRVQDVFDPDDPRERRRLFLLANRLHRTTDEDAIAAQLPFRRGDRYSRRLLAEGERLLRQSHYLYAASIRPVRFHDDRVDLEVVVRDTWTLKTGVSLGRAGGASHTGFQLQDLDLLGTGKALTVERTSGVDRTSSLLEYVDPNLLGTHGRLTLGWAVNSDGTTRHLDVGRPFYSLDTRWALGARLDDDDRSDTFYSLGHVTGRFAHRERRFELHAGRSSGLVDGWTTRWSTGLTWQQDRFGDVAAAGESTRAILPERVLAYPWVAWDRIEDRFAREHNLDHLDRTEDLPLGTRLHGRLGFSSSLLGATRDEAVFDATGAAGYRLGTGQTLFAEAHTTGRLANTGLRNFVAGGSLRYYRRDLGSHLLFGALSFDVAHDLDPERQLLLGGDSGLRGYPLRYQDGDYRALLTVEQRWFTGWYPLRLVHVGAAAFADVGRAWGAGRAPDLGWLRDVGVGLRLGAGRSGFGSVTHVDLAMPLDGDPSIARLQWLITTRETF